MMREHQRFSVRGCGRIAKGLSNGGVEDPRPFQLLQALTLQCHLVTAFSQLEFLNLAAGGFGVIGGLEYVFGY